MLKKNIYQIFIVIAAVLLSSNAWAQESISMYNMRTLPQTSRLNPAFQTDYNGHMGGLISPFSGQLLPDLDINFHSSSFAYNDFIYGGDGIYSDSLIWAFNSHDDALKFVDKLDKVNHLTFGINNNILNFGFRTKKLYWSFNATTRTNVDLSFPGGLVELMVKGNAHPDISPNMDLSGFGVDFMSYLEVGLGASMEIMPELKVGIKAKALAGVANVETVKTDLYLDSYNDSLILQSDIQMRASQPAFILEDLYYDFQGDSLVSETTELETNEIINNLGYDFSNPGFAIDLGAEYEIMPELKAFASVTDIGFIQWNTNVAEVSGGGKFFFEGIDGVNYIDDNDTTTTEPDIGETYEDSLLRVLDIKKTGVSSYKTWLPTRVYVGGTYNITDAIGFGGLYRGVIHDGELNSAVSISANANTNHISATITYTVMEDNFDNIGIGFAGRFGPLQMYIMSDHVLEEVFPQTARDINIRMGVNWIFGYKKDKAALIE
ncbi:DUF5723 family protein [Salinivirga cyanobacteriivorans]